jgi:hypothetical protein
MPIPRGTNFHAERTRSAARRAKDGPESRQLLALAAI